MVEFALVVPVFILLVIGLIEFAVTFSTQLNVNFASRDAALLAAEAGNGDGADCVILQSVETALNSPTDKTSVQQVRIYQADVRGNEQAANVYSRTGSTSCTFQDGTTVTVPYSATSIGYPETGRCTVIATSGCGGLDLIGIAISYRHVWVTPLPDLVQLPAGGITFTRSNTMRMEPTR